MAKNSSGYLAQLVLHGFENSAETTINDREAAAKKFSSQSGKQIFIGEAQRKNAS
jgi:hypothetical protein